MTTPQGDLSGALSGTALSPEEYERRKAFLTELQGLSKSEYIEILRILKNHGATLSENLNGVFFNLCTITPDAFAALQLFRRFTIANKEQLVDREKVMNTLTTTLTDHKSPT